MSRVHVSPVTVLDTDLLKLSDCVNVAPAVAVGGLRVFDGDAVDDDDHAIVSETDLVSVTVFERVLLPRDAEKLTVNVSVRVLPSPDGVQESVTVRDPTTDSDPVGEGPLIDVLRDMNPVTVSLFVIPAHEKLLDHESETIRDGDGDAARVNVL